MKTKLANKLSKVLDALEIPHIVTLKNNKIKVEIIIEPFMVKPYETGHKSTFEFTVHLSKNGITMRTTQKNYIFKGRKDVATFMIDKEDLIKKVVDEYYYLSDYNVDRDIKQNPHKFRIDLKK